jgi:hypothetical protein
MSAGEGGKPGICSFSPLPRLNFRENKLSKNKGNISDITAKIKIVLKISYCGSF